MAPGVALDALARELCDRHTGIGADGLILYEPTADGASMRLLNADGSWSEVSGNGVRGLAALLLARRRSSETSTITIHSEGGVKRLVRTGRERLASDVSRAAMGLPADLRQVTVTAGGRVAAARGHELRQPAVRRARPAARRGAVPPAGPALEHHEMFPGAIERRVRARRSAGRRADPDLGARRRADDIVGHRIVRVADRRRGLRRCGARRRPSSRRAARSASSGATTASTSPAGPRSCSTGDWLR